jgi:hypothetical protein
MIEMRQPSAFLEYKIIFNRNRCELNYKGNQKVDNEQVQGVEHIKKPFMKRLFTAAHAVI